MQSMALFTEISGFQPKILKCACAYLALAPTPTFLLLCYVEGVCF